MPMVVLLSDVRARVGARWLSTYSRTLTHMQTTSLPSTALAHAPSASCLRRLARAAAELTNCALCVQGPFRDDFGDTPPLRLCAALLPVLLSKH